MFLARHTPAPYYTSEASQCTADDIALGTLTSGALHTAISNGTLPAYAFVTPDACDDMHGAPSCSSGRVAAGDAWLSRWMPQLTGGTDFRAGHLVIIITWDEGSDTSNHIPTLVISPSTRGVRSTTAYTHCSTLRTAEDILHLAPTIDAPRPPHRWSARSISRKLTSHGRRRSTIGPFISPFDADYTPRTMAKLYFYYSAMNAGKTTTLLQSAYNYRERGMRTLILTPRLDDRSGEGVVASRIGLQAQGRVFDRDDDLLAIVGTEMASDGQVHCVLVDEAQFLTKTQVWQITEVVDALGVPVLAYGLRTDFMGELFEGSQYLLAWADSISEIKTICHTGKKATMVVRVDDDGRAVVQGPQVQIGGNERYVSVSRSEFKKIIRGEGRIELPQQSDDL